MRPFRFKHFFQIVHPHIKKPYILCSSCDDLPVFDSAYLKYINDPKIIKCFIRNINIDHPKVIAIPIGLENKYCMLNRTKNLNIVTEIRDKKDVARDKLMYMNFNIYTFTKERRKVWEIFSRKSFVKSSPAVPFRDYLIELKRHIFCLSPAGNGVECHRTWEAMYMGCIPIICPMAKYPYRQPAKGYDELYHDLPVIVVDNWEEVTEEFLSDKLEEFRHRTFNMEKLYFPYWKDLISSEIEDFRHSYQG